MLYKDYLKIEGDELTVAEHETIIKEMHNIQVMCPGEGVYATIFAPKKTLSSYTRHIIDKIRKRLNTHFNIYIVRIYEKDTAVVTYIETPSLYHARKAVNLFYEQIEPKTAFIDLED